ncbi:glycerophosphodiester phosphodiesterase domain-containing protein 5 isoform X2 [Clupea harengus]|uniref:Glycerophosphodiester phosphodiesterase domain-containing protein 5 isoform X2 n=1 Tax=Clupea harengus TaxID=7950 RepID=A0A6P8FY19_CLUHA|nr:glycerophosphodiester phosphodiesterase domain-containing protein 5 isoform X2 [Clupea harengus]
MVKHQPLQVYERQLCLSCLTGIYGCRWKRYQRSHDDTTKWEGTWFFLLSCSFFLLLVWAYFWWEAHNDYNEFNWLLYNRSGEWSDGTVPILTTTVVGFTYTSFLMGLALCHISLGQQMNMYWIHKVGVLAVLLSTITGLVSIDDLWRSEWNIVIISLQFTGPFLHIGALAAVTALGWLVAGFVVRGERSKFQIAVLVLYFSVLLALCLAPVAISSPCVMDKSSLSPRPLVIGRRGAPMLAPENTLMSFNKALQQSVSALEADVAISLDGVPFLMRDRTLRRTTNVQRLFPQRQSDDASLFTWTQLRSLNAGLWFLKEDPFWTVSSMSPRERRRAGNQTVCSLADLLRLAVKANCSVLFSLRRPPPGHPRYNLWIIDTLRVVQRSGIPLDKVMWTPDADREKVRREAPRLRQTSQRKLTLKELRQKGITAVTLHYSQALLPDIRQYLGSNMSVNVQTVNDPWLFSVLWCSGVTSVSSEAPNILKDVPYPIWLLSPDAYYLIWIACVLVSFAAVVAIFVHQKWKMSGMRSYNPEQIMLSAVVRRPSRDVNIMKEKLIFSEINSGVGSTDELSMFAENGYVRYTHGGIPH